MMVASTIVPLPTNSPRSERWALISREHPLGQLVPFQQPAEVKNRGLVRDHVIIGAHPRKLAHRDRVVERFLRPGVRQVVPLLQAVDAEHPLHRQRRATAFVAALRIVRLDQRQKARPRHHPFHLGQEHFAPRLLALVKVARHRQRSLGHLPFPPVHRRSTYSNPIRMTGRVGFSGFP